MTEVYDQYGVDDSEVVNKPSQNGVVSVKKGTFINEIKMGDQTLTYVTPEYIEYIARRIADLENKNAALENELKNIKSSTRQRDTYVNNAIKQINTRFGFNG